MTSKTSKHPKTAKNAILVPVDFSEHSAAALAFGAELADDCAAELVILHAVHDPGESPGYYAAKGKKKRLRKLEDVAREMMDEFVAHAAKASPDSKSLKKAQPRLVVGLPVTRILDEIKSLRPRMVVMGSQGRTGLSKIMLGSKAEQTTRLSPVPVVIVRPSNHEE